MRPYDAQGEASGGFSLQYNNGKFLLVHPDLSIDQVLVATLGLKLQNVTHATLLLFLS